MAEKIYLVLENGKVFTGKSFGKIGETKGELVFTTAMTGYLETLTDPSYFGQIVIQTFPLIGNYGVIPQDFESERPHLQGYIVRDWCNTPSNFRSESDIDSFLKKENIVGLYDIDTRCLTRIIREQGVMRAKITQNIDDIEEIIAELKAFTIENSVETVSTSDVVTLKSDHTKHKVVLWDFGAKGNISKELLKRGCDVTIVPYNTSAAAILAMSPDGIMLSNGPGNPADNVGIISELAKICEKKVPIFGICLGHQLLALSQGGKTEKLKYGHRGANQPVVRLE
ncbi:MAG: carbamoyl phosphate synthase small subunit, partial [Oscillospiraceae bacterium]